MNRIRKFLSDESGINHIEFALLVGLIALVLLTLFQALGETVQETFFDINSDLDVL